MLKIVSVSKCVDFKYVQTFCQLHIDFYVIPKLGAAI